MVYEELLDKKTIKGLDNIKVRSITSEKTRPSLVIIDGGQGLGKTTLAHICASYIAGYKIPYSDYIGVGGINFSEKYLNCQHKKIPCAIYDEGEDYNKKATLSRFNRLLTESFSTMRGFNIIIFVTLPCFKFLDKDLFSLKVPRKLFHIYEYGVKKRKFTTHGLYRMLYVKHHMKDLVVEDKAYWITRPNYIGSFKDLPEDEAKALHEYTMAEKLKKNQKNAIKLMGVISIKDIAKELNRSTRWVIIKLKARNIEQDRIISGRKYYDEHILDLLAGEIKK